jgi:hypothetical protein
VMEAWGKNFPPGDSLPDVADLASKENSLRIGPTPWPLKS